MTSDSPSISTIVRANPRGWLIVLFIFGALGLVFSARMMLSVAMPTWEAELGWARTFISSGGSVVLVFMTLISPLAGNLLDKVGPRPVVAGALLCVGASLAATSIMTEQWQFIVLFCIIGGLGYGALAAPQASATIGQIFDEHRGLATGIATSGASGGLLIILPILAALIGWIGWRASFVGFGFVVMAMAPIAWFLITPASRTANASGGGSSAALGARLRMITRNSTFWLLLVGFMICGFTTTGVIEVHLIPYAISCGFPPFESATALGVLSGFNMAGMILAGYLADKVNRPMLLGAIYFLRALTFLILMNITGNRELLFLFAILFGIVDYSVMPVLASIVSTHIGVGVMGLTLGLLFAGHSAGAAAGAFMGGYFFDAFASYDWVWIVSIALALMAAVVSWMIRQTRESEQAGTPVAA
ncbi:MAG: MFS transporter [Alphaproteobacteria bacterium]|jgi:MFS family permease|nr:MFS transporter [Alphaproteobacteria bacterium]